MIVRATLIIILLTSAVGSWAQTQLVLLNHETILARFRPGSIITLKVKHDPEFKTLLIADVLDYAIVTSFDTIPFNKITRVSLKGRPHKGLVNLIGNFFFLAGVGYFAVDQINSAIVHGQGYDSDPQVWKPALALVGTGLIMKQFYKRSQRIRYPAKLLAARKGSLFFLPEQ